MAYLVAKSYLNCAQVGQPFEERGKRYITVETKSGTLKRVRIYKPDEWKRMYPELADTIDENNSVDYRKILGFGEAGYITIFYGNTYENLDWFKRCPETRYHKLWGWYMPSGINLSDFLPTGVRQACLHWGDVSSNGDTVDPDKVKTSLERITSMDEVGSWGEDSIGDRVERDLTVTYISDELDSYGSRLYYLKDGDGRKYSWKTNTDPLTKDKVYDIIGTVKDLKTTRGEKVTVLTRCRVKNR